MMLILYAPEEYDYDTNGICVLSPSQASVAEQAGGKYELHLEHPFDPNGKFRLLAEEYQIKAPVPPVTVPAITLPEMKILQTNKSTDMYSKMPVTTYPNSGQQAINAIIEHPERYAWSQVRYYNTGEMVTQGYGIYRAKEININKAPLNSSDVWAYVGSTSDAKYKPVYNAGEVVETLASGEMVTKIADFDGEWFRARSIRGKVGYVARADCVETVQTEQRTIPQQVITEQVFRIYKVDCNEEEQTVSVDARHVSYDFQGNALYACVFQDADPMTAISMIQGSLMIDDNRTIASNITGETVSGDWSFKNPVNALLSPTNGLVALLDAKLVRNNADFYLLNGDYARKGITIKWGVNMRGVHWTRNNENVITRIVPRCYDSMNDYIYLDDIFVDAPDLSQFAYHRIEVMDCQYTVGETYEQPDGTTVERTAAVCKEQMAEDAARRFSLEHADAPEVTLDVDFILLGDTDEYRQYRDLQTVRMYDKIMVKTEKSRIAIEAQVTEYQWDCLRGRYHRIQVGNVSMFKRRVPGYRVVNQSITYDKLAPDLINRIRSANVNALEEGS